MSRKRRVFSSAFKAKVAIEAIRGHRTISELAQKHKLHTTQINLWKKQLSEGAEGVFEQGNGNQTSKSKSDEPEAAELYEQIGRLKVQLEWLKKKVAQDGE
jgi:putative transposase